jgi:hypothetical protein
MSGSIRSIIFSFQWRLDKAVELLRSHGFPKELDEGIIEIIRRFRDSSRSKNREFTIEEAAQELETLKKNWQKKKRRRGANARVSR